MILAIILVGIICFTAVLIIMLVAPGIWPGRDSAARDRDRGLARLYEARADLMHVEEMERRDAIRRRDAVEARLVEARRTRQRDALCEEVRQ